MASTFNALDRGSLSSLRGSRKALSEEVLSPSRINLNKKTRQTTEKESVLVYKRKKQLEGEESEKEPETTGILQWKWSKKQECEIYSLKFSPDGKYLVLGAGNGILSVYTTDSDQKEFILQDGSAAGLPCTGISFRPDSTKSKNIFAASYADGTVKHWHLTSGQLLGKIQEGDVQTLCVNYSSSGSEFVTSATDNNIRIYDAETHKIKFNGQDREENGNIGHTNRIFCAKFHPKETNMLISGGWDDNILIWDSRRPNPVRSIFGPRICGDAIDFDLKGEKILTGSYSRNQKLQVWSWASGELIKTVKWSPPEMPASMLYTAQFSKQKDPLAENGYQNRFILAGGSGQINDVKLFSTSNYKPVGSVDNLNCSIFASAMSDNDKHIAIGGGGRMLMFFELNEQLPEVNKLV